MFNFWGSTLKHKKVVLFLLLFFVLSGIFMPNANTISAATSTLWLCNNADSSIVEQFAFDVSREPGWEDWTCQPVVVVDKKSGSEPGILENFAIAIIMGITNLVAYYANVSSEYSALLFQEVAKIFLGSNGCKYAITNPCDGTNILAPIFLNAWNEVKKWANMLLVLGFIGIAIAFILNLDTYKKLLVPLLITALLVNFSIVFVGLTIDASNITMISFLSGGPTPAPGIGMHKKINDAWDDTFHNKKGGVEIITVLDAAKYAGKAYVFALIYLALGVTLLSLSILYVTRYVMLAILFILAPLAFASKFFPVDTVSKIWTNWWRKFLQWCFAGLVATFFLGLGSDILTTFKPTSPNSLLQVIIQLFLPLVFMLIGLKLAIKLNPLIGIIMAAAAAIGMAIVTSGASLAMSGAKGASKLSGLSNAAGNVKNRVSDAVNNWAPVRGIRDRIQGRGATATRNQGVMQKRLEAPTKRLQNTSNEYLTETLTKGKTPAERAAATILLKDRNKLNMIPETQRQEAMSNAIRHDGKLAVSDFAKADYRYAEFDQKAIDRVRGTNPIKSGETQADHEKRVKGIVRQEQLEANLPGMSGEQLRNIDVKGVAGATKTDLTPELITSRAFTANMVGKFKTADAGRIGAIKNPTVLAEIKRQRVAAESTGNKAEVNRLRNIAREINKLPKPSGGGIATRSINQTNNPEGTLGPDMPTRGPTPILKPIHVEGTLGSDMPINQTRPPSSPIPLAEGTPSSIPLAGERPEENIPLKPLTERNSPKKRFNKK